MNLDRMISDACDALADADDTNRVARLNDVAAAYEAHAGTGCVDCPDVDSDSLTATLVRGVAGADLAATGQLSRLHHRADDRYVPVLERMAAEPELRQRAAMLADLVDLIDDDTAAEAIAHLPYGGLVGGRDDLYMPRSFPKLVRNVYRRWRETRAA